MAIHSKLFRPKSTILISKSAKYRNLPNFVTETFKFKIGLSRELNDFFEFIEKAYSLRINSQFKRQNIT